MGEVEQRRFSDQVAWACEGEDSLAAVFGKAGDRYTAALDEEEVRSREILF